MIAGRASPAYSQTVCVNKHAIASANALSVQDSGSAQNTSNGSWGIVQVQATTKVIESLTRRAFSRVLLFKFVRGASPLGTMAVGRSDLNNPPTAVGGIRATACCAVSGSPSAEISTVPWTPASN
jgi:hypothetical protein